MGDGTAGDHRSGRRRRLQRRRTRRAWRSIVLAPLGDGTVRRRGSDGARVVIAGLIVLCCSLASGANSRAELAVVHFLTPPPNGISWLVTATWWVGSLGVVLTIAFLAFVARHRALGRDLLIAGVAGVVFTNLLRLFLGPDGGVTPSPQLHGVDLTLPVTRIVVTLAVATVVIPYLSRSFQRLTYAGVILAALATVVHGSGTPLSVASSFALGWGIGAAIHLGFGSPVGLPSGDEVIAVLQDIGVDVLAVRPASHQVWGVARYEGDAPDGRVDISLYGRDAHDAQLLAKVFRMLAYRDSGPTLTFSRLQEVEHEAYLILMAERCGGNVPSVIRADRCGASGDAVLVTNPPRGQRLVDLLVPVEQSSPEQSSNGAETSPDAGAGDKAPNGEDVHAEIFVEVPAVSDEAVEALFRQVSLLHDSRLSHGAISPEAVVVGPDSSVGLVDFRYASIGSSRDRMAGDCAAAMVTASLAAGVERSVRCACEVIGGDRVEAALPFLQKAALNSELARSLKGTKHLLRELRVRGAQEIGVDPPKLIEPRRMSWANLIMVVGTLVGGWALIDVLVNVSGSLDTIAGARWGWVVGAFLLSQMVYPAGALSVLGSVLNPIPFGRAVQLEVSNSFVSLAGGSIGTLATRVRFFQQQGYDATVAVSSGVLVSIASWIVKALLLLASIPFVIGQVHLVTRPSGSGHDRLLFSVVLIVALGAIVLGVALAVPRIRRLASDRLRPQASKVLTHLRALSSHPRNFVKVLGGAAAAQLAVALALGAALHAFDHQLGLGTLIVVLTFGSIIGGVSPVPGGMGVVEAGMILGMTAVGVPDNVAVSATFIQRMFTAYLPPIWGWFVLAWMRRKEYL